MKTVPAIMLLFLANPYVFASDAMSDQYAMDRLLSVFSNSEFDNRFQTQITENELEQFIKKEFWTDPNHLKNLKLVQVDDLSQGAVGRFHYQVLASGEYELKLSYKSSLLQSASALLMANHFLLDILNFGVTLGAIETYQNARAGDPRARIFMAEKRMDSRVRASTIIKSGTPSEEDKIQLKSHFADFFKPIIEQYQPEAERRHRESTEALKNRLSTVDPKTSENLEAILIELVKQGQREKTADLLEQYLPYEKMTSIERYQWKVWLEAIRDPLPTEQLTLVFRGDKIGNHTLNESGAVMKFAATLFEKKVKTMIIGDDLNQLTSKDGSWSRLTTFLGKHANSSKHSPFISFTVSPETAARYAAKIGAHEEGGIAIYIIDPRKLALNGVSAYPGERECLSPLFTFPDEYVGWVPYAEIESIPDDNERTHSIGRKVLDVVIKKIGVETAHDVLMNSELSTILAQHEDINRRFLLQANEQCAKILNHAFYTK